VHTSGIPLAHELDAFRLELFASACDVGDAKSDPVARTAGEFDALVLGFPDGESHVPRFELGRLTRVLRQLEHVPIERHRPLDVPRRDVDEIDPLDLHHGVEPSRYGA
jgi:hypothetical protein